MAILMAIPIAALAGNREEQKLPETLKAGHCHRRFRKFFVLSGDSSVYRKEIDQACRFLLQMRIIRIPFIRKINF